MIPPSSPATSVVLLAAGYGTRLYPLTKNTPKALLPVDERVVLDLILDSIRQIPQRSKIVLISNRRFVDRFRAWQKKQDLAIEVLDDGTESAQTRLGAIRDLQLGLDRLPSTDDTLVLGSDNLFTWSLADFVQFGRAKRPAASVAVRQVVSREEAKKLGVATIDASGRMIRLTEKPAEPESLTIALCVYYFPAAVRQRIEEFIRSGGNVDAPGFFIEWLVKQEPVYGFPTTGEWFDIGSQESYDHVLRQWSHDATTSGAKRQKSSGRM